MLGEVGGIGDFDKVLLLSETRTIYDYEIKILSVNRLIFAKEMAGREKDVPGLKILYALRDSEIDED